MLCPSCGFAVDQPDLDRCPRCGRTLTAASAPAAQPPASPASQTSQAPDAPQTPPSYAPYPLNPAPTPAPASIASTTPTMAQDVQGLPPTPPGPPAAYADAAPAYPQTLLPPLPRRRQRRTGLIVGVIVVAVVLLAACGGGAIWATRTMGQASNFYGTPSASTPASSGESVVYYESFSTSADGWVQDPGHCYLDQDGYHARNSYLCFAPIADQADGSVSVYVQQLSGLTTQGYGLAFRNPDNHTDSGYRFAIISAGEWAFAKCVNGDCTTLVDFTPNSAIKGGLHTANTLKVAAKGSHFDFFVNDTKVGSYDDATFASGAVGIFGGDSIDCVFTHFTVSTPLS